MEGENAIDILPLAPAGGDARAAVRLGPAHEMVDRQDVLSFVGAVDSCVLVSAWVCLDNAVQPVLDTS